MAKSRRSRRPRWDLTRGPPHQRCSIAPRSPYLLFSIVDGGDPPHVLPDHPRFRMRCVIPIVSIALSHLPNLAPRSLYFTARFFPARVIFFDRPPVNGVHCGHSRKTGQRLSGVEFKDCVDHGSFCIRTPLMRARRVLLRGVTARALCARACDPTWRFFSGCIRAASSASMRCDANLNRVSNRRSTADFLISIAQEPIDGSSATAPKASRFGDSKFPHRDQPSALSLRCAGRLRLVPISTMAIRTRLVGPAPLVGDDCAPNACIRSTRPCHRRVVHRCGPTAFVQRDTDARKEHRIQGTVRGQREGESDSSDGSLAPVGAACESSFAPHGATNRFTRIDLI